MRRMTRVSMRLALGILFGGLSLASPAHAFELSEGGERNLQVAAIGTAYGFAALHGAIALHQATPGEPLDPNWVGGTFLSAISLVGMSVGQITLAVGFTPETDTALALGMGSAPGLALGSIDLWLAIEGVVEWQGGFWMDPLPAGVELIHGLSLGIAGGVLAFGANSGESDLSKIGPIYSWMVAGALIATYAVLSLALE